MSFLWIWLTTPRLANFHDKATQLLVVGLLTWDTEYSLSTPVQYNALGDYGRLLNVDIARINTKGQ